MQMSHPQEYLQKYLQEQQRQNMFNTISRVGAGLVQAGGQPQIRGQPRQNRLLEGMGGGAWA